MLHRRFLGVVVVTFIVVVVGRSTILADEWEDAGVEDTRKVIKREVGRSISERFLEVPRCKQSNESCSGFPRCCDKLRCFWERGFDPFQSGICVTCIQRSRSCQTDAQCCEPFVCQKSSRYQVDGVCESKRPEGQECHDDDQCQSNYCLMTWYQVFKGQGGRCTPRST